MSRYYVEGTFEGYIEADSADEAEGNFDESDIEDISNYYTLTNVGILFW